jgi:hypothetical protein
MKDGFETFAFFLIYGLATLFDYAVNIFLIGIWIVGVVLAEGFWLKVLAFVFPFYGFYLVAHKILSSLNII